MYRVCVLKHYNFKKEHAGDKQTVVCLLMDTKRWALPFGIRIRKNTYNYATEIGVGFLCFTLQISIFD